MKKKIDKTKRKLFSSETDSKSEEWYCLICSEAYGTSNNEDWVECIQCKMWAHVKCVVGDVYSFICFNCHSDED